MSEELPDTPMSAEPVATEAGAVPASEKVFGGVAGSEVGHEAAVFGVAEQSDVTNTEVLDKLYEQITSEHPDMAKIMNNPAFGHDGTLHIDGKKVSLSEYMHQCEQRSTDSAGEDNGVQETGLAQSASEDNQTAQEHGPTPEEIERRIEEKRQQLIAEKIEQVERLAQALFELADNDMDSVAVRGTLLSGERVVVADVALEPNHVTTVLEALRDNTDRHQLVERVYGTLEREARQNVMQEIATENLQPVETVPEIAGAVDKNNTHLPEDIAEPTVVEGESSTSTQVNVDHTTAPRTESSV